MTGRPTYDDAMLTIAEADARFMRLDLAARRRRDFPDWREAPFEELRARLMRIIERGGETR